MSSVIRSNVPARLVLGRATFHDPAKPDAMIFDVLYRHPDGRVIADGLSVVLAEDFPLLLKPEEVRRLPGLPFGDAVIRALSKEAIAALIEKRGQELQEVEIRELIAPLLRSAAYGEVIIAGVLCPPSPDPQYVPFAPNMLPHWRFIPGQDVAEPRIAAAVRFMSIRVFTNEEWTCLNAIDRRLRVRSASTTACSRQDATANMPLSSSSLHSATIWMRQNVTKPGQWKRQSAIMACRQEANVTDRAARAAWDALTEEIRGTRGKHK